MPRTLLELAAFAAVILADARGLVPLTLTVGLLPLAWLLLRFAREPWGTIGLRRPASLPRTLAIGVFAGVAMEALAVWVTSPAIGRALGAAPDYSDLAFIRGDAGALAIFLALSWTLAAFGEEACFRGFLMSRLSRLLGGSGAAWAASLLVSSAVFGAMHSEQGVAGAVQEGLSGLLLGALFLLTGRNLVAPIVAHGVSNTVAFVLIYLGRYPGAH